MIYTVSNTIKAPHGVITDKFSDPDGLKHWMPGLEKAELLEGTLGKVGARTNLHFIHKEKPMVIEETILEENMPNQIKFAYKSSMGYNEVEMKFEVIDDNSVTQINNSLFEFKGFMKIMAPLMKGLFKKQSMKYMTAFKEYAEKQPKAL
jgi:hypothetical protein